MLSDRRFLAAVSACILLGGEASASTEFIGEAYDLESQKHLYSEQYRCSRDFTTCQVRYIDSGGDLIADKRIDFAGNGQSPALQITDHRQNITLNIKPYSDPDLVVDAGFDNFVRKHWVALLQGNAVEFEFLPAGRNNPLKVQMQRQGAEVCSVDDICLEITFESWLVSLMVESIKLTYDKEERRLKRFRGISNLADEKGRSQFVDIRYSYTAEVP